MRMAMRKWGTPTSGTGFGPVLLLLIVAVVAPTACLLWLITQATQNERLAIRQKLENAYRAELQEVRVRLEDWWRDRTDRLTALAADVPAGERFAKLVDEGLADSFILCNTQGELVYPVLPWPRVPESQPTGGPEEWVKAEDLIAAGALMEAAGIYQAIADQTTEIDLAAQALMAQARCLGGSGHHQAAIDVLVHRLSEPRYGNARDSNGRLIVPSAQLVALEMMAGRPADQSDFGRTARDLRARLLNYREPVMPTAQRLFLMERLGSLVPQPGFERWDAEKLALDYVESQTPLPSTTILTRTLLNRVWQLASEDKTVVALLQESRIVSETAAMAKKWATLPEAAVWVFPTGAGLSDRDCFLREPVGQTMTDWQFNVKLAGPNPFAKAAERQIAIYWWTGILVILACAAVTLVLARHMGRQVRLTRLKNDLIATVSHELKTPLSSVRVLVETLLDNECGNPRQTREYLEMIARENQRLSRLIDNFLTFSRMERNKRAFEMRAVSLSEVAKDAVEAVHERFHAAGFQLEIKTAPQLPQVTGDRDALVTLLVNLLDNALKYARNDRRVAVRINAVGDQVCMAVEDHGIGLSRRDIRRIFDRFYQVDRSLSRESGGCGLGLSIVEFIVDAHGGRIDVRSQPGQGSTFSIWLPARVEATRTEQG
ncbi:MAG TPA: HAMP domain-containing sensor histidine kinase [Phycisphaerae bacterium]|nr:HAMP domain-containing sensor histidine kinase [Phycisphaerae bacterium]HRY69737.1 HAMP domain-containing sensor histidine kinase [Phycisphaerae bacterium]HSA29377.1 HAMP domain-containing sensor histidine kinase [Phycisphaerae bacterium]